MASPSISGNAADDPVSGAPAAPAEESGAATDGVQTTAPTGEPIAAGPLTPPGGEMSAPMPDVSSLGTVVPETPPGLFGYDVQPAIDLVSLGGPVVVVLLLLSVLATTVVIMKVSQFVWLSVGSSGSIEGVLSLWLGGHRREAYEAVARSRKPAAVVLGHGMRGLLHELDEPVIREDIERVAMADLARLRSHMRVLEITVQAAPLLGLFGTVLGMISAFQALQAAGANADPAVLAGGIWVALMTTAVGLALAIPMAFISAWLEARIEREQQVMEMAVTSLLTGRATDRRPHSPPIPMRVAHAAE